MKIHGTCLCGGVAFELDPPFAAFQYCYCSRCRKRSGSAHAANIFVSPPQFAWLRGAELVRRFELPTAKAFNTGFCATCHAASRAPWAVHASELEAHDGEP